MQSGSYTAFEGYRRLATGPLATVALTVRRAIDAGPAATVLIFDDTTGRSIDIDTRGSDDEIRARFEPSREDASAPADAQARADEPRGRGRPKLGVVAREVTLLPRHWDWLGAQPGGASVALRKLVDEARRARATEDRSRAAKDRTYHFMSAIGGDLAGFEEATRALYANDHARMEELIAAWPDDVRDHALALVLGKIPPGAADEHPLES
ncbi:hypothetical protein WK68_03795 [Burkholderia ubonensis]|uniref:DUF2239 family protein n=1 Tax=Burkholderia ubonensis TaxID=101571 RepID=A0AAU8UNZ7_9BURK|nr:DUF2239 family protein [Burkholderia ubonensis]AOK26503.1 hypothetical protein WK67_28010 [Burkholderia ubonensis]KVU54266.1 hypothetical protein WK68_03795 [Burkholderia ubonensis]